MGFTYVKKAKKFFFLLFQRLILAYELFNRNGLANHAAASAYGFLLSAAPAMLVISFFISRALAASNELAAELFLEINFLSGVFDIKDFINNFLASAASGLGGFVSVITFFWTARLCALSVQRGLGVIFPGTKRVLRNILITLFLAFLTILFIFIVLVDSVLTFNFFNPSVFLSIRKIFPFISAFSARVFSLSSLALITLAAYCFGPQKKPKPKKLITGALVCIFLYLIFSAASGLIISPDRYNLLYGTLGRLFLFLLNVYFFFVFFFFGAVLIKTLDISNALFFIRFKQGHSKKSASKSILDKLFSVPSEPLKNFIKHYKKDSVIFSQGSKGQEVYYILSGKAGVYLDAECSNIIARIEEAHFFGEMESVAATGRAASIKAETDLSALVLPPELFHVILELDPETDQTLIKSLSEHLDSVDKQVIAYSKNRPAALEW